MVELRLETCDDGVPKDCFVSVRIGDTQKLSRLSSSRLYRFPQAGDRRCGKIEVFRRIGSCSVDVDPANKGLREVNINCDPEFGMLCLKVAVTGDDKPVQEPTSGKKEGSKVKAAKEYLSKHRLEMRLSEAMQAVLRERPGDPAEFLAAKLLGSRGDVSDMELPPVSSANQQAAHLPKPPAKPQKLEPMQEPAMPAALAVQKSAPPINMAALQPVAVLPFQGFYVQNFRSMGRDAYSKCHARFPVKNTRPAAIVHTSMMHLKPSVGTWMHALPKKIKTLKLGPTVQAQQDIQPLAASFQLKPSVGTWLVSRPPAVKIQEVEKAFRFRPSVGTWLSPRTPTEKSEKVKVAFGMMPSVGTWLTPLLQSTVPSNSEVQGEVRPAAPISLAAGSSWVHKPSVGTWLAKPTPVPGPAEACPHQEPFHMRPSVGTWLAKLSPVLVHRPTSLEVKPSSQVTVPEDTVTTSGPTSDLPQRPGGMLVSAATRYGPSFGSLGLRPMMMLI